MYDRTCAECGAPLCYVDGRSRQAKFCSLRCRSRINERRRPPRRGRKHRRTCQVCRATFTTTWGAARYCSDECRRFRDSPSSPVPWAECPWCGHWFVKRSARKYCSKACLDANHPWRARVTAIGYGECRRCGVTFVRRAGKVGAYCSLACNRRARKNVRKHLKRAAAGGESFTLRQIAERDGWRCHLCGRKVPDRTYEARDKDPTLDHLVPVSDGGTHTRDNVALAHNRCNWERNVGGEVQLRLVG